MAIVPIDMNEVRQVDRVGESAGVSSVERSTPWRLVKGRVHLSLPAGAGRGAARTASKQAYGRLLFRHHPVLGGVVVAHEGEVKLVSGPKYVATSPFAHVAAETTLLLFAPCVGCILTGVITYVGPDHIGLTVHSAFHAVLPFEDVAPHYVYSRMLDSTARWQRMHSTDGPDASAMSVLDDGTGSNSNKDYVLGGRVRFVVTGVQTTRSGLYQLFGSVRGGSNSSTSGTGELGVIDREEPVIQFLEQPTSEVAFGEDEPLQSVLAGLNSRRRQREREQTAIFPSSFSTPSHAAANAASAHTHPFLSSNALPPTPFTPSPAVGRRLPSSTRSTPMRRPTSLPPHASSPSSVPPPASVPPLASAPLHSTPLSSSGSSSAPPSPPPAPPSPPPPPPAPPSPSPAHTPSLPSGQLRSRPPLRRSLAIAPPTMTSPYGKKGTKAEAQVVVPFPGSIGNSQIKEELPTQASVSAPTGGADSVSGTPVSEKKRKKRKTDSSIVLGEGVAKASKRARSGSSTMQVPSGSDAARARTDQPKNEDQVTSTKAAIYADAIQAVKSAYNAPTDTRDSQAHSQTPPSSKKSKSKSGKPSRTSKGDKTPKSRKPSKGSSSKNNGSVYKDSKEEKHENNVDASGMTPDVLAGVKLSRSHSHLKREAHEIKVPKVDDDCDGDIPGSMKKKSKDMQDDPRIGENDSGPSQTPTSKEVRRTKKRKLSEDARGHDQAKSPHKKKSKVKKKCKENGEEKPNDGSSAQKKKSKLKKGKRSREVSAVDLDRLRSLGGSSPLANAIFEDMFDSKPPP